jgi:hypothetical protein
MPVTLLVTVASSFYIVEWFHVGIGFHCLHGLLFFHVLLHILDKSVCMCDIRFTITCWEQGGAVLWIQSQGLHDSLQHFWISLLCAQLYEYKRERVSVV